MFFENQTGQETYERLKYLDKDVKLHWVLAGKNPVCVRRHFFLGQLSYCSLSFVCRGGSAEALVDIVSRRRENATNVIIPDSGHLVCACPLSVILRSGILTYLHIDRAGGPRRARFAFSSSSLPRAKTDLSLQPTPHTCSLPRGSSACLRDYDESTFLRTFQSNMEFCLIFKRNDIAENAHSNTRQSVHKIIINM